MNYKQINFEERVKIEYLFSECKNKISYITSEIKRSKSAIAREILLRTNILWLRHKHIILIDLFLIKRFLKSCTQNSRLFKKYFDKKWHGVESAWAGIKLKNQTFQWHLLNKHLIPNMCSLVLYILLKMTYFLLIYYVKIWLL